jgi:hypothetical protein
MMERAFGPVVAAMTLAGVHALRDGAGEGF